MSPRGLVPPFSLRARELSLTTRPVECVTRYFRSNSDARFTHSEAESSNEIDGEGKTSVCFSSLRNRRLGRGMHRRPQQPLPGNKSDDTSESFNRNYFIFSNYTELTTYVSSDWLEHPVAAMDHDNHIRMSHTPVP